MKGNNYSRTEQMIAMSFHHLTCTTKLHIYLSIFSSFCLFISLSFCLSIFSSFHLSIFSSFYLFVFLSFHLFIFLYFHLSIFSSFCLFISLIFFLSILLRWQLWRLLIMIRSHHGESYLVALREKSEYGMSPALIRCSIAFNKGCVTCFALYYSVLSCSKVPD